MKSFYIAISLLAIVITVTFVHISRVNSFQTNGIVILQRLDYAVSQENFSEAIENLDQFYEFYQGYRQWFSLFLDTADLEKKEVHITRMRRFLEFEAKTEFYNEFVELYDIVNTLPYREGIHFEILF